MGAPKSEQDAMQSLLSAAEAIDTADGYPPVDRWEPEYCGEMDLVIKRDGSWWHEGARIGLVFDETRMHFFDAEDRAIR